MELIFATNENQSIGTSDYHTTVASAASDGSLLLSNCGMGFYRRKQGVSTSISMGAVLSTSSADSQGMLFQRLYELDVDESTSAVRLAHGFAPEASGLEEATSKAGHKNGSRKGAGGRADALAPADGDPVTVKTGAWRPSVGVHRATWQTGAGLSRAGWLASAGAAGLVRVDNVQGKWLS